MDCGSLLWYLQNTRIIQILGTAYYHPVLPLIARADWDEQLERWQGLGRHLFNRQSFSGFWPPEMGFCMELIPTLKRWGYHYVLVDSEHVQPVTPMRWEELRYRPHIARFGGEEIIVVIRDRELSNAQEGGIEPGWFLQEVLQRTKYCEFPPLVTTCTDGENGGWFRNTSAEANFWGYFYQGLMERVRANQSGGIHPVFIDEYLARYGAHGKVSVGPGAWNPGWHHGTPASSNGQVRRRSRRPSSGLPRSARPYTPRAATPSPFHLRTPSSTGGSKKPIGESSERRPAATSSGAKHGFPAPTTTSTRPAACLTKPGRT